MTPTTHRLDVERRADELRIGFRGVLDRAALDDLAGHLAACAGRGGPLPVRVVLRAGTLVEHELVSVLARWPGVTVEAESPFLAHWLSACARHEGAE